MLAYIGHRNDPFLLLQGHWQEHFDHFRWVHCHSMEERFLWHPLVRMIRTYDHRFLWGNIYHSEVYCIDHNDIVRREVLIPQH